MTVMPIADHTVCSAVG